MVLTLVTMTFATLLHAVTNHLVDAVLALILMIGGVTGAQFGARAGQKIRGEHLRLLLGLLILAVGLIIGFIGAIMGIGGGFILIPIMIYFLRVPTSTVIGTSMVLTLVTMTFATLLHAVTNHLVDAVLALILMIGGVTGAQFGARAGQKIRGEHLRLLLGLLILAVGIRFAVELVIRPDDLFTIREAGGAA